MGGGKSNLNLHTPKIEVGVGLVPPGEEFGLDLRVDFRYLNSTWVANLAINISLYIV